MAKVVPALGDLEAQDEAPLDLLAGLSGSCTALPGKPNWYCSLKLANDKRTFKSTGLKAAEKNRAAALSLCEQWQRIENDLSPKTGSENHLKFENSREVAEQFVTATRKLAQGGFTEADARALLDELLKAGRLNPLSQESVEQFFRAWLEGKELAKKKRTAERYRKVVSDFLAALGVRTRQPVAGLTPRDIEAFRSSRLKEGCSPVTVAQDLKIVFKLKVLGELEIAYPVGLELMGRPESLHARFAQAGFPGHGAHAPGPAVRSPCARQTQGPSYSLGWEPRLTSPSRGVSEPLQALGRPSLSPTTNGQKTH